MIDDFGKPILHFYAALLHFGVQLAADEADRLVVSGITAALSPAYQQEIIKRAAWLVQLVKRNRECAYTLPCLHCIERTCLYYGKPDYDDYATTFNQTRHG